MRLNVMQLEGVIPPMVTPLTKNGEIDLDGLEDVAGFLLDGGVHGLFVLGTVGEGPKFSREERKKIIEAVISTAGLKVPVMAGTGGISTKDTITFTKDAKDLGAAAAVIHPPWYYHPSPEALLEHFKKVASEVDIPLILYNIPFVGYTIPTDVAVRASQIKNVVGLKDSGGDLFYYQQLIASCQEGFNVIQGYGSLFLPSLAIGGKATMAGEANIAPKIIVGIYESYLKGEFETARRLHYKVISLLPIFSYGTFPDGVKEAMNMMGVRAGYTREPSTGLNEVQRKEIENILRNIGLI